MTRTAKYVGLDVHQATIVGVVRDASGRVIDRRILPTDAAALSAFLSTMRGCIHVVFEEGTQAQWLYDLLEPLVDRVVVCNRRETARHGNKNDWQDAAELAELLRRDAVRAVYHTRSPQAAELKELARLYLGLVGDSTRVMARLKALYRARAICTRGRLVYNPTVRSEWLAKLPAGATRFRAELLYAELEVIQRLRQRAKAALLTAARRQPEWAGLRAIPGLGLVRVALLLALVQTPWRFRTKRHLWAYAGLAVTTRASAQFAFANGAPVRQRRAPLTRGLNRNHHPVVKAIFKSAATTALTRPGALQAYYDQLVTGGMRAEMARVTLTRKLAAVTLHIWKTGDAYDPAKLTAAAG